MPCGVAVAVVGVVMRAEDLNGLKIGEVGGGHDCCGGDDGGGDVRAGHCC